jgi:hypothetical protein
MSKLRIYIGPTEVSGFFGSLATALNRLGADATFVTFEKHLFNYSGEGHTTLGWLIKWANKCYRKKNINCVIKLIFRLLKEQIIFIHFIWALIRYDVFIFGFGHSLLFKNVDVYFLRLCRKKIICHIGLGSDSRPPYCDGNYQSNDGKEQPSLEFLRRFSFQKFESVRRIEKNADLIISSPFTSQFNSLPFVNSTAIGFPYSRTDNVPMGHAFDSDLRILHSPSHPACKGSAEIRRAIGALHKKGHHFNYIELHGRPNDEIIHEISKCSFVIDQLYSDVPMAGFATEAAWFGKPSIVGGYGLNDLKRYMPDDMCPPSHICHPDDIEGAIEKLIIDVEYRVDLGIKAAAFVHSNWTPESVAKRFLRLIEGDIPESWWLDPKAVTYLHGWGLPENRIQSNVKKMVEEFGVSSLQLSHRPALERAFLKFAGLKN